MKPLRLLAFIVLLPLALIGDALYTFPRHFFKTYYLFPFWQRVWLSNPWRFGP